MIKHWLMWGAAIAICAPSVSNAQQMQVALGGSERLVSVQQTPVQKTPVKDPLSVMVNLELHDVSRKAALDAIAQEAGIQVIYSRAVVPLEQRVSVSARSTTLAKVLDQILAGTQTVATPMADGSVVIARAASIDAKRVSGVIQGKVLHAKTKQPISGARVILNAKDQETQSDAQGVFLLEVPAGAHSLQVRSVGFVQQSKRITVTEEGVLTVEVLLEPSASVLDEVIVTGTVVATERKAIATPITVVTADDIEKRGITRIDELFRGEVPGVIAMEEGSYAYGDDVPGKMATAKVYSRGSSGLSNSSGTSPLKTYIDGVELLDPAYLGTIDPRSIERIEIVTGPQAATIYGSGAMGGVMQIFTKKGRGQAVPDLTLSLRYGMLQSNVSDGRAPTHNHGLSLMGGSGPEFSYSGNLSYNYSGQWQPGLYNQTYGASIGANHVRGPITVNGSVSSTGGRNGTAGNNGSLVIRVKSESGEWWASHWPPGMNISRRISTSSSQTISFNANYQPMQTWQHHITIGKSQTNFALEPEMPNFTQFSDTLYRETASTGSRTTANYNTTLISPRWIGMTSTVTIGANGSWGDQLTTSGCTVSASSTSWVSCASNYLAMSVSKPINDKSWGAFTSVQIGVIDQLYVTLGLRGEKNPTYGQEHKIDWTPTNGVAYTFEHNDLSVKLLGSYGRATRAPAVSRRLGTVTTSAYYTPSSYVSYFPNPYLTPEYSRGPQGGIEIYYGNLGSLTINHYQQTVTDLIQSVIVDSIFRVYVGATDSTVTAQRQYRNVAKVRQYGWEATASMNIGALSLKGAYSWADSKVIASTSSSFVPGKSFLFIPTHMGSMTFGYAEGATNIRLVVNAAGASLQQGQNTAYRGERSYGRLTQYVNRRRDDYINLELRRPGYMKSDLVLAHRLSRRVDANLNIKNLGNSFGAEVESSAAAVLGRQTSFGFTLRLP